MNTYHLTVASNGEYYAEYKIAIQAFSEEGAVALAQVLFPMDDSLINIYSSGE